MVLPCEQAIWDVVPKIRADLSKELVKKGMKQKEIAELLELTPAAVSQYVNNKRGGTKKKTKKYSKLIENAADSILCGKTKNNLTSLICKLCVSSRE